VPGASNDGRDRICEGLDDGFGGLGEYGHVVIGDCSISKMISVFVYDIGERLIVCQ
jgi:hypothetical protein